MNILVGVAFIIGLAISVNSVLNIVNMFITLKYHEIKILENEIRKEGNKYERLLENARFETYLWPSLGLLLIFLEYPLTKLGLM